MVSGAVIGRDAELDFVERFLDKVGGGPTGLVVSGEARIRKTVLWQVAVERARGRVAHVLTCRGREARVALSFAGLLELFGGLLGEATGSLLRPRRRALVLALLLAEPGERPPDAPAIAPAVHDLLGALARRVEVR